MEPSLQPSEPAPLARALRSVLRRRVGGLDFQSADRVLRLIARRGEGTAADLALRAVTAGALGRHEESLRAVAVLQAVAAALPVASPHRTTLEKLIREALPWVPGGRLAPMTARARSGALGWSTDDER